MTITATIFCGNGLQMENWPTIRLALQYAVGELSRRPKAKARVSFHGKSGPRSIFLHCTAKGVKMRRVRFVTTGVVQ